MVVCKCRKATKLYCFVHKAPVCGDCISFPEHQLCVVKTYSDWVIDGDYDWPPKCGLCQQVLVEADDVARLGCFHLLHENCLQTHLQSFPPHTAPAGYTCPSCSTPIWPPELVREPGSGLHSKLKQIITKSGVATNLLGNDLTGPTSARGTPPLAFSSSPLVSTAATSADDEGAAASASGAPVAEDGSSTASDAGDGKRVHESFSVPQAGTSSTGPSLTRSGSLPTGAHFNKAGPQATIQIPNGAMARKNRDSSNPSAVDFDDDDDVDGSHRKYNYRGPWYQQLLRSLLPFWSPAFQGLPVTTPMHRDKREGSEDTLDGRSRRKQLNSETVDSRKILLWFAIMSCMVTVILLYYRLSQGFGSNAAQKNVH